MYILCEFEIIVCLDIYHIDIPINVAEFTQSQKS